VGSAGAAAFSAAAELNRLVLYTIPSLALLWYLIIGKGSLPSPRALLEPGRKDLYPFLVGFPVLVLSGAAVSFGAAAVTAVPPPPGIPPPQGAAAWTVTVVSCLLSAYLEESYFRYYLLSKLEDTRPAFRVPASVALFALCHVYEGPWGVLNAVLAGGFLCFLYERRRSLHGIALAHAAYNIFVYHLAVGIVFTA
jgi:membrane protease YdiL (CAAX protease family)